MFCANCGAEIAEGANFCESCGTPVAQPEPAAEAPAESVAGAAVGEAPTQPVQGFTDAAATPTFNSAAATKAMGADAVPPTEQTTAAAAAQAALHGTPVEPAAQTQPFNAYGAAQQAGAGAPPTPPTTPVAAATGAAPAAKGKTGLIVGIVAVVVVLLLVVFGAFSCKGGSSSGGSTGASSAADAKAAFVGTWELESGDVEGLDAETIASLSKLGLAITLDLKDDGTGTISLFGEESKITWKATSSSAGTLEWDGEKTTLALAGGKLDVVTDDGTMTFVPAGSASTSSSSSSSSASSSSSSNSSSSASGTSTSVSMQTVGNAACGYIKVPSTWIDNTSGYDKNIVDSTEMVCYADPTSSYSSSAFGHTMYSDAIQMRCYATSYTDIAKEAMSSYGNDTYSKPDYEETTFNGKKCYIITTTVDKDDLYLCNIALDRDGDGHSTVLFTIQGKPSTVETVLGYAASWSKTK